jgi:hypothetical protein
MGPDQPLVPPPRVHLSRSLQERDSGQLDKRGPGKLDTFWTKLNNVGHQRLMAGQVWTRVQAGRLDTPLDKPPFVQPDFDPRKGQQP